MLGKKIGKKALSLVFVSILFLSVSNCADINNPFWPRAKLTVGEITSLDVTKGVSILQSFQQAGEFVQPLYKFNDPTVKIINQPGLPQVNISEARIVFKVGNDELPATKIPVSITVPSGGEFSGTINILRQSTNLINSAFPGNSFAREQTGSAKITLIGKDDNGYISILQFSTPVNFETDPSNFPIKKNEEEEVAVDENN